MTLIGAGTVAFASGLVVDASNASVAVLGAMLTTSLLSLAAAAFIAHVENVNG